MSEHEAATVRAIIASMSDAVAAAWRRQEDATAGHMRAALALHRTLSTPTHLNGE